MATSWAEKSKEKSMGKKQRARPDQPSTRGRLIGGHVLGRKIKGKINGKNQGKKSREKSREKSMGKIKGKNQGLGRPDFFGRPRRGPINLPRVFFPYRETRFQGVLGWLRVRPAPGFNAYFGFSELHARAGTRSRSESHAY